MRAAHGWLPLLAALSSAGPTDLYTTNIMCKEEKCVNPIYPALEDMQELLREEFTCSNLEDVSGFLDFCKKAIDYHPALPVPATSMAMGDIVKQQERRAATAYFFHLGGLGLEAWDATQPWSQGDPCLETIWRLSCWTLFPRAKADCKAGEKMPYVRPCQSSCLNYIKACGVQCCDESVDCVFEHTTPINATAVVKTVGYVEEMGPSSVCTGAAAMNAPSAWLLVLLCALIALNLQGCDDVPTHRVGAWRAKPDYLLAAEFVPPGSQATEAILNSCSITRLSPTIQCSGHGVCRPLNPTSLANPTNFCYCDRDWAGSECSVPRKSQSLAFTLSLFGGVVGADQFYLGFPIYGALKLCSLGGFGLWWIYDVVRLGSAPVYANSFRLAADLPRWTYVLSTVTLALLVGFVIVSNSALKVMRQRRKNEMLLHAEASVRAKEGGWYP